ncbi:MAG: thiamine pyrophosphate-binding protein [Myxococcota bacterium]|nr:thiamine pyrophosphate-binding protein [Myxococcota bacterium]
MGNTSGGELVVEALRARDVSHIFSISGGHINPIYLHLEDSPIELLTTRHEQAAVFMAEAFGRMTRRPGVALVTAGPGFTNALSAVANAHLANSPLLLISGAVGVGSEERLDLQDMHQGPVIAPMVKRALVCHRTERIPEYLDLAWRTASSGRPGPVYLEIPADVLGAEVDAASVTRPHTEIPSRAVDRQGAHDLVAALEQAERPLVIAGSGAWYADAGAELTRFVTETGVPTFTLSQGRGLLPDPHPLCFESSLPFRPGAISAADAGADLVVLLGSRLSLFHAFGGLFRPDARIVQVDTEPEEIGRNRSIDLPIASDVRELLAECSAHVAAAGVAEKLRNRFSGWIADLEKAATEARHQVSAMRESDAAPIHPLRLTSEVDAFMDREDDVVVADGGDTQVWMGMARTVRQPGHYLDSGLYGCLGVGLPYAHAARLAHPRSRVCLVTGDGSIGFNFMEFETAVRKGLNVVTVIANDCGWGMIRHSQRLKLGHSIDEGAEIGRVPYHDLVSALGGYGALVERPEDLAPALEDAFASGLPACLNVMTDPEPISPGSVALAMVGGYKGG